MRRVSLIRMIHGHCHQPNAFRCATPKSKRRRRTRMELSGVLSSGTLMAWLAALVLTSSPLGDVGSLPRVGAATLGTADFGANEARAGARALVDVPVEAAASALQSLLGAPAAGSDGSRKAGSKSKGGDRAVLGQPEDVRQRETCESDMMELRCGGYGETGGGGDCLKVHKAIYGRLEEDVCPDASVQNAPSDLICAVDVSEATSQLCEGRQDCSIAATNELAGDPCWGVYKYLTVEFSCGPCAKDIKEPISTKSTKEDEFVLSDKELRALDRKWVNDVTQVNGASVTDTADKIASARSESERKIRECVDQINGRHEILGYTDDAAIKRCAMLNAVAIAEVSRILNIDEKTPGGADRWARRVDTLPDYPDYRPEETKGDDGLTRTPPRPGPSCHRDTAVEALVVLQRIIPFWPFHIDDPCARAEAKKRSERRKNRKKRHSIDQGNGGGAGLS